MRQGRAVGLLYDVPLRNRTIAFGHLSGTRQRLLRVKSLAIRLQLGQQLLQTSTSGTEPTGLEVRHGPLDSVATGKPAVLLDSPGRVNGKPADWGVCKVPASAGAGNCGLGFDVVPGHSELSIVPCRVASLDHQVAMPPVGHNLIHAEGVELLKAWIDSLPEQLCQ